MISKITILSILLVTSFTLLTSHQQFNYTANQNYTQAIADLVSINKTVAANSDYSAKITDNKNFVAFLERP